MKQPAITQVLTDKELGPITIHTDVRAKRLTFRTQTNGIKVTVPTGISTQDIWKAIEQLRPRLLQIRTKLPQKKQINTDFKIESQCFKLSITIGSQQKFMARSFPGNMQIICPPDTDFSNETLQQWLTKVIKESMRNNAKRILPPRLQILSKQYNLPYRNVKINSSTSRWGSCSTRKDINLSLYLILLPEELIDYVLLHELTHTRIMSHSADFWELLDSLTDGKSYELRQQLKKYNTSFL